MPKYFSYSFGSSDLAPTSAPSKKSHFWEYLDEMKPNPTLGHNFGFIFAFIHTPQLSTINLFCFPPPLHTYPLTSYFFLLFSLLSPFLTHNLFFFLCDLFIVIYFSFFFGFSFPFFVFFSFLLSLCVCVCVCWVVCGAMEEDKSNKKGRREMKKGTTRGATRRNESLNNLTLANLSC